MTRVSVRVLAVAAVLAVVGCQTTPPPAPTVTTGPATAERHMISAANPLAAEAGRAILRRGGSAVDAAIAAQMVLNLVEPQSSGIGGGAFLMHFDAGSGRISAFDGRETAPAASTPDMFLDADGKPRGFYDAAVGGLSVGVPGLLRMLESAHREYGRLPWADLFEPAIELAEKGFAVSPRLHDLIAKDKYLKTQPEAAAYFHDADGAPLAVGTKLVNRPFAEVLRRIAGEGADAFYTGTVAADIAAAVRNAPRNPGRMVEDDLAAYESKTREPACLFYRQWLACGMPPPSSGGITTLQILGILQGTDIANVRPGSVEAAHLLAEAGRLAFADRDVYIADPDFIPVPTAGLLDPGYLDLRAHEISPTESMGKAFPGMPGVGSAARLAPDSGERGFSTTHLSVVDDSGDAVSMTSSIENAFGSRLMVHGFLLNNQLTDFAFRPEIDGAPVANRVAPGKRPRSSMAPTLVFDGGGRVVAAIGSPGGSRIIGYVAQSLIALLDWKMDIQAAIDLPHVLNRNGDTELEAATKAADLKPALEALGHTVTVRALESGLHGIHAGRDGLLTGGADPRREGVALGD